MTEDDPGDIEFSGTLNRLTNIVQEQYRNTLSKAIRDNYSNWTSLEHGQVKSPTSSYVEKWTDVFEKKAVRSCMIAQFYRKEMLTFMNQIKEATKKGQLLTCNFSVPLPSFSSQVTSTTLDKSTQTDKEKRQSLSDRDISFLKDFRRSQSKRPRRDEGKREERTEDLAINTEEPVSVTVQKVKIPEVSPEQILDIFDDPFISDENLEHHLSAMFNDESTEMNDPEINFTEYSEPPNPNLSIDEDYDPEIKKLLLDIDQNNRLLKTRCAEQQEFKANSKRNPSRQSENTRKELMKSIWPCKLYHHRKHLQENLLIFSEQNSRNSDLIKQRFLEIFGEDSDDDIGAFSPSHDMDSEMLLSSSKKRVAPMVVQNLMEPFKKGLVGDKAAFKSMAQDFTECIIANDMYPSFLEVKGVIDGYFDEGQNDADIDINALLQ
ncbi:hypothetical protein ACFFRR_000310 [Megaselia abdita]